MQELLKLILVKNLVKKRKANGRKRYTSGRKTKLNGRKPIVSGRKPIFKLESAALTYTFLSFLKEKNSGGNRSFSLLFYSLFIYIFSYLI